MQEEIFAEEGLSFQSVSGIRLVEPLSRWSFRFLTFKTIFDKGLAILVLPIILGVAAILVLVNPFLNPGSLFYTQERMGMGGRIFRMIKFRTMLPAPDGAGIRRFDAPLEEDRITVLGRFLRRSRLDELPNFLNVLCGDMSVVGPRPDALSHSTAYIALIPHYADRFRVRPGITGLAQVSNGYADTLRSVERKARLDCFYVRRSRFLLDLYVIRQTIRVMITGFGAR